MTSDRRPDELDDAPGAGEETPEPFRILFVCTGNTCRSPMAESVARRALEERGWGRVQVESAGISTLTGLPASDGSIAAARARGLDLSGHESARLNEERVERADLILGMTPAHVEAVEELGGEGKTALLGAFAAGRDGGVEGSGRWAVPDPFGGDEAVYLETLDSLERMIERALDRLEPVVAP